MRTPERRFAVDDRRTFTKDDRCDRSGGVATDSGKREEGCGILRHHTPVLIANDLGCGMKKPRPTVVAKTLPESQYILFQSIRKGGETSGKNEP